jgi:hypothetical protein
LFGAVDLFSPFTPFEADREWRRGVDAVRCDLKLTDRASLDVVAAFGESGDRLSLLASLYLPYGAPPEGLTLVTAYGAAAISGFLQARIYF